MSFDITPRQISEDVCVILKLNDINAVVFNIDFLLQGTHAVQNTDNKYTIEYKQYESPPPCWTPCRNTR